MTVFEGLMGPGAHAVPYPVLSALYVVTGWIVQLQLH